MEKSPLGSRGGVINESCDPFSLREWGLKAKISRENTLSRRFSASHITSFREDGPCFRSNITISSTASSPGYSHSHTAEEIDPSTYSFTNALKALQARSRSINTWECLSPDGFAVLNSKWNEAEKYICNPLSGEVPMECLSAKTLSGRSFRGLTNRITMSAPLIYPPHSRLFHTSSSSTPTIQDQLLPNKQVPSITQDNKLVENMKITRDVGTQSSSTPQELISSGSGSPTPASTPPIQERSIKVQSTDSPDSTSKSKSEQEEEQVVGIRQDKEEEEEDEEGEKKSKRLNGGGGGGGGFLCLRNLWTCRSTSRNRSSSKNRKQREKDKPKTTNIFVCHFDGSSSSSKI